MCIEFKGTRTCLTTLTTEQLSKKKKYLKGNTFKIGNKSMNTVI